VNAGFTYREHLPPAAAGRSVLAWLCDRYAHSDAVTWRARIDGGEVELGGRRATAETILRTDQVLAWQRPPWEEPAVPLAFAVVHRDAHLLAVAKPRGLPTTPAGGFLEHTLLHAVRRRWPTAVPLHRLGRGTSGLTLFGLSSEARRAGAAAFREGQVKKDYRALVRGVPARERFTVDFPIAPVPHRRLGGVHAASAAGRPALSHVRVLEARGETALVGIEIPTGRPHQIRIHLAYAGHPLVGDCLYGAGGLPLEEPGLPGDLGYWLHAHRLSLPHPGTHERLALECAPPPTLREG
jgi:23S rRNA pseudouridine1911/1915/1917 synthase